MLGNDEDEANGNYELDSCEGGFSDAKCVPKACNKMQKSTMYCCDVTAECCVLWVCMISGGYTQALPKKPRPQPQPSATRENRVHQSLSRPQSGHKNGHFNSSLIVSSYLCSFTYVVAYWPKSCSQEGPHTISSLVHYHLVHTSCMQLLAFWPCFGLSPVPENGHLPSR